MSGLPGGLLPARPPSAHKGDCGHVLVIGGSVGLTGAPALCALGALRAGAGRVTAAAPRSQQPLVAAQAMEVMTLPLAQTKEQGVSLQALPELAAAIERVDVIVLGPGLSQQAQVKQAVRKLLPLIRRPCVIDADGLNALAEELPLLKKLVAPLVVTPHPGEMGRLLSLSAADVQRDRERIAGEFAKKYRAVTVLKGHRTVVANIDGQCHVNETGNPGMATAGMGDVLAGMIGGLLGQGLNAFDASRLGVYLHGLAGDLAAEQRGAIGLLASDLLATIPVAIRRYQQRQAAP
jgi:NAD(P)H-hydrate epimerase